MAAELDPNYPNCPLFGCGGIVNISYPFWRIDNATTSPTCGYGGFGINCSAIQNRDRPIITLHGNSYYIKSIDYDHKSFTLVDMDAATDDCPRVRHNIDLSYLPLTFSRNSVNLSFHFNCTQIPSFARAIPCLRSGEKESCVHVLGTESQGFNWDQYCDEEVVSTVLDTGISPRDKLAVEFGTALSRGFKLNWQSVEGCHRCEQSYGRCGHFSKVDKLMCFCSEATTAPDLCKNPLGSITTTWMVELIAFQNLVLVLIIIAIRIGAGVVLIVLICTIYLIKKLPWSYFIILLKYSTKDDRNVEDFIKQYGSLTTKRYKYAEIKKMTNSFQVKLGQGGFGSVFKGNLVDGLPVAVKILNSSKANGEEFVNEVASIGRTSHINVVNLLGFCYEHRKRALIYEFMPNGSLEKFILLVFVP